MDVDEIVQRGILITKLFNEAGTLMQKNNYNDAVVALEKIISIAPDNAGAYHVRGLAYKEWNKSLYSDKMIADFEKAVELQPTNTKYRESLEAGYGFEIKDSELIKYNGSSTNVVIPSYVTSIGNSTFEKRTGLESIVIPSSVTTIGYNAFYGCVNLTSVTIPSSVKSVGFCAFAECKSLTSVTISSNSINFEWGIFADCINLSEEIKNDLAQRFGKKVLNRKLCYIATAVYGSYDCPQVWTLRRYRDFILSKSIIGRSFISIYYAFNPIVAKVFLKNIWFNRIWRTILDKLVTNLHKHGIDDTPYMDT